MILCHLAVVCCICFSGVSTASSKQQSSVDTYYSTALEAYKAGSYREANSLLLKTWAAFNSSVKAGLQIKTNELMIVDLLRFTAGLDGQIQAAIMYSNYLLRKFPHRGERFVENLKNAVNEYELELDAQKQLVATKKYDTVDFAKEMMEHKQYASCQSRKLTKLHNNAYCRLDDRNRHPLLLLSPVREEILSSDPVVIIFHDLVTASEVEAFKTAGKPNLRFAAYYLPGDDGTLKSTREVQYRKASIAWLYHDPVPNLTRRMSAIVGLNSRRDSAEEYQVCHYNVGGHFIPHFDAPIMNDHQPPKHGGANAVDSSMGKRLATLMIYLNDVEEGGSTTFPLIDISVKPKYRTGLFWYNLHRNDSTIFKTIHAGCPVLKGEKWIVNKWFRSRGQIFTRRCPLDGTLTDYNVDISDDML